MFIQYCFLLLIVMLLPRCSTTKKPAKAGTEKGLTFVSYNDPHLQYEGRTGFKEHAAALYWSGATVRLRFTGTGLRAILQDYNGQNFFNVIVDGRVLHKIRVDSAKASYTLAENLVAGEHVVELFKRTQINKEYNRGYTWFYGFEIRDGGALPGPAPKERKMEFYGNSITAGHAIEDTTGSDSGASMFENNYLSYAASTARHYRAAYSCIAVSGIGLMAGYRKMIMPEMYDLLNPFDTTDTWDFSRYTPDVVVVNLLQNDEGIIDRPDNEHFKRRFGTAPPTDEFIIASYRNFISKLRMHYPDASIICVLGNMGITRPGSRWPALVEKAVKTLNDKKVYAHFFKYKGTPGHPGVAEQKAMAESLIKFIDSQLAW